MKISMRNSVQFSWLDLFFLVLISSSATSSSSQHKETDDDKLALLAFKDGITSDPFGVMSTWNNTIPLCGWHGVVCSTKHSQKILELNLTSSGLSGTISSAIGNLTFLRTLDLRENNFYGEIPSQMGRLRRLKNIRLSYNSLHGSIPANFSSCSNLMHMNFSGNWLSGSIPSEFGSLKLLEYFSVANNSLIGAIPPSFGNLSSLLHLDVGINHLHGTIPEEFVRLEKLVYFNVNTNMLQGRIPLPLFNISSLGYIIVAENDLHGSIPATIGITLPNLTYLLIGGNKFNGPVPVSLSNATKLTLMDLSSNIFTGTVQADFGRLQSLRFFNLGDNKLDARNADEWKFFDSLANCTRLEFVGLNDNQLGGVLPESIANFTTQITGIYMFRNHITGSIPRGIENLFNLDTLAIGSNLLSGFIPVEIGKLSKLLKLNLSNNTIEGNIPSSLGNLSLLIFLDLSMNQLDGIIPSSLGNLQRLNVLDLSNNDLNGSIPEELLRISSLSRALDLSSNSLSGPLPSVGALKILVILYLGGNKLSGKITTELTNCEALQFLSLANNNFEGVIPPSLGNLKGLEFLGISANNLTGPIPETLQNLPFLYHLNLSFNNLEGPVPMMGVFKNASGLVLSGNSRLCGGIPELHLPACSNSVEKHKHLWLNITIPTALIFATLVIFCLVMLYRKFEPPHLNTFLGDKFPKISYREIVKATDHFSSANLIGEGKYSSVYKGRTLALNGGNLVAVKVLNLQVRGSSKSFYTECKALRSVRHRNLLKILTACSSLDAGGNEFKALVFEYMPNGSLEKWLHPQLNLIQDSYGFLSLFERLKIAIDIARALEYLHHNCQPPIVHCDLKPVNVLLDDDMVAHVADFGLAKLLSPMTSVPFDNASSYGAIRGTIGYLAPEYGAGGEPSTAGDCYSYGILLLEMITGRRPVNDMFRDGLTLYSFVEMNASPDFITKVADPSLLMLHGDARISRDSSDQVKKLAECLLSIVEVGLHCSHQEPVERPSMVTVANKLQATMDKYFSSSKAQA